MAFRKPPNINRKLPFICGLPIITGLSRHSRRPLANPIVCLKSNQIAGADARRAFVRRICNRNRCPSKKKSNTTTITKRHFSCGVLLVFRAPNHYMHIWPITTVSSTDTNVSYQFAGWFYFQTRPKKPTSEHCSTLQVQFDFALSTEWRFI